jgi:hypothetical protein
MSGKLEGRISRLEQARGVDDVGGSVTVDERFSFVHGEWPGITPALVIRIENSWAWESSGANHG